MNYLFPPSLTLLFFTLIACNNSSTETNQNSIKMEEKKFTSFQEDVHFLKKHTGVLVLTEPNGQGKIAICPALQGRVMTSTSNGDTGRSYGWINRILFESGDTLEHINPFGGEERFWLGPEGGQFSIFFEKSKEFTLENWQTPPLIDLIPFELTTNTTRKALFEKSASLSNYSGFSFDFTINRAIEVFDQQTIFTSLGLEIKPKLKAMAYQTVNTLTNTGLESWKKETGLLSIWLLGMFNPSPSTTVVIPFIKGEEQDLGSIVNDDYFGKVPSDRLKIGDGVLFFSGDGKMRGKIGLSPKRAKDICGSYDSANKILTIVKYNKPENGSDYVNSLWQLQENPYAGDVINSYNDGPPEPGAKPLGPFYELETSSPALALGPNKSGTHIQQTYHFEGEEADLDQITRKLLGISLDVIKSAFN